jgi:hypothetical protein
VLSQCIVAMGAFGLIGFYCQQKIGYLRSFLGYYGVMINRISISSHMDMQIHIRYGKVLFYIGIMNYLHIYELLI